MTGLWVVDADGGTILEATAVSEPADIADVLAGIDGPFERSGFEAGPVSPWLYKGLTSAGLPAVGIEAWHAKAAMAAMNRNKNGRNDARSLAQLIRSGWFESVHGQSMESQERRTLLMSHEVFVSTLRDHETEIRGLLRPVGLKVGRGTARDFETRVRAPVDGPLNLERCMAALRRGRAEMQAQRADLHRTRSCLTANDDLGRRFMTIPGVGPCWIVLDRVGPVTALAFKATIDDPGRVRRSSDVGAHLGLIPRHHQSGETDVRGRISRSGDAFTRAARFTAAPGMLPRSRQWRSIRAWGVRIAKGSNLTKAKIAVARKLAVVMHRMGRDDAPFHGGAAP